MKIAFYAPLKAPASVAPSGDRLIGRLFLRALSEAGHTVDVVSTFRSFDIGGNTKRQKRLRNIGDKVADRVIRRLKNDPPDLWFTYHLYHKAPDWVGPKVSKNLGIPYVVAEASYAPKQKNGSWSDGLRSVEQALKSAQMVIGLSASDRPCVEPLLASGVKYVQLSPFLDTAPFVCSPSDRVSSREQIVRDEGWNPSIPWLLTVAMMRPGVKTESYDVLAKALIRIKDKDWHLIVVGDGGTEREVKSFFEPISDRVTWLGRLLQDDIARLYAAADIYLWPSVRETPGMSFIEAGAAGLPVVGGNGSGVPDVVKDGETGFLATIKNHTDFANKVSVLLEDEKLRRKLGDNATRYITATHDITVVSKALDGALRAVVS
jgi:glycosyltransferase involved in cell wall biosynthesis